MNYMREILGSRYLPQKDWEAKKAREAEEFRARLAGLPVAEAKAVCVRYLAIEGTVGTLSGRIATEFLATKT